MYAIVKICGRQYQVTPNELVKVDHIDLEPGDNVTIKDVMLIADKDDVTIGTPYLPFNVNLEIVEHGRYPKVTSGIFKRRGGMRRKIGHKRKFSVLRVKSIEKGA